MNKLYRTFNAFFLLLLLGCSSSAQAGSDKISCAFKNEQQFFGALPEFTNYSDPLQGLQCQLTPHYSGFLGNWFPALPSLYLSQSSRVISSNNQTDDDISKAWKVVFSIKRFGRSQISFLAGQKDWQQVLKVKSDVSFIPTKAKSSTDAITIGTGQYAQIKHKEEYYGLSLILPFQDDQILTELRLQKATINQPIQANVLTFEEHSLFTSRTVIDEIMIISKSQHKGINLNWEFSLGQGKVLLDPKDSIQIKSEFNQVISLRGQLELYYQHRINRRWFSHAGWLGAFQYLQQSNPNDDFQLANANHLEHQISFGIGLNF